MQLLASTNRDLESVAIDEIRRRTGAEATAHHPGMVRFEADPAAVVELNRRARSLHRVLVVICEGTIVELSDVAALAGAIEYDRYLEDGQAIAVRSQRHGDHAFTSVDVAEVVGQAVIDGYRDATGHRLPVDLDDPDVVFRAMVRHDRFALAIDATGETSLHRRPYRVCEHETPIRPTLAYAMLHLAGYRPGESLVDPFCGGGTIPIEAALYARDETPNRGRDEFAFRRLPFLDGDDFEAELGERSERSATTGIAGVDRDDASIECARENAAAADVDVDLRRGDATSINLDADAVIADLPFGIRSDAGDLRPLYREIGENLAAGDWNRLALWTVHPDLLPLEPDERYEVRHGRLDVTLLVARR